MYFSTVSFDLQRFSFSAIKSYDLSLLIRRNALRSFSLNVKMAFGRLPFTNLKEIMLMNIKFCLAIAFCAITVGLGPIQCHNFDQLAEYTLRNNIGPRKQWNSNEGYCGEVSLISAGLYFGQYISQYQARAVATKNSPQDQSQLLLGINDVYAATKMHLKAVAWKTKNEKNSKQFLAWVKKNVVKGYPVAIGIFTNEYLFYKNPHPEAGDNEYDHIVPVIGFQSKHVLTDAHYYGDDIITFSDNGLWGNEKKTPYIFSYGCDAFLADRRQANAKDGAIYSLSDGGRNYGIAIVGVMDRNDDTVPVRVETNVNYEKPAIKNGSNVRPTAMPLILTITVSGLKAQVAYNLYKYDSLEAVPNEQFNAHAGAACKCWRIRISSGSTYVIQEKIQSDEVAVYRAVKASAQ